MSHNLPFDALIADDCYHVKAELNPTGKVHVYIKDTTSLPPDAVYYVEILPEEFPKLLAELSDPDGEKPHEKESICNKYSSVLYELVGLAL